MEITKILPVLFTLLARGGAFGEATEALLMAVGRMIALFGVATPRSVQPEPLDAKWLQQKLKELGHYAGPIDGDIHSQATRDAVLKFQKEKGILIDSWAGPETFAYLVMSRK